MRTYDRPDDARGDLGELRATLPQEHVWRMSEGLV